MMIIMSAKMCWCTFPFLLHTDFVNEEDEEAQNGEAGKSF